MAGDGQKRGAGGISDPRFANFETDPRYRLPSKRRTKIALDKRFSRMLKDEDFIVTAQVDRYGRKIKSDTKEKALRRLYRDEREEDRDIEVDDDGAVYRELQRVEAKYDPARGGGFSESESDSESESESESESDSDSDDKASTAKLAEGTSAGRAPSRRSQEIPTGEVTRRLAVVNLDWDHIRSIDLMALFSSFVPDGGRIEKVSIYPSEFGKERMQQEELEGPPKEIFRKSKSRKKSDRNEDSDEEIKRDLLKEENDQDFDSDALRIYQLDRLRYYYAVMVCSDKKTAEKIYQDTDGREYQSSSNIIDLRFVPDDVTFEDEPRDECDKVPEGYRPLEFTTDALQHSKVKLTWDLHPEEASRSASMKNAFRGSRADIDENDLRAYLASDSEDDQAAADETTAGAEEQKMSKKELARKRMREALGLSSEPDQKPSKKGAPVGNMEITFATALSSKEALKTNDKEGETTLEKYMRKERERKAKKKKERAGKSTGEADAQTKETPDLGFDDPFFTAAEETKPSAAKIRKEEWRKKREVREAEEQQNEEERKQLELLMDDDDDGGEEGERRLEHFDMAKILRAEKEKAKLAKRKGKKTGKSKAAGQESGLQEGFVMDLEDPRFSKVFTDPEFAIDPSHPEFRSTESMRRLLAEKRRKRSAITGELDAVDAGNPDIYGADRQRTKVRKLEER